jgi:hypothetical protein
MPFLFFFPLPFFLVLSVFHLCFICGHSSHFPFESQRRGKGERKASLTLWRVLLFGKLRPLISLRVALLSQLVLATMRVVLLLICECVGLLALASGCGHLHHALPTTISPTAVVLGNPIVVPAMDREYLWQQTVDTVDDYFKIAREERMRDDGGVVTDGRIHTFPETASSYLEPWRKDSTPGFERLHATLQSIRRYATVHIAPAENGYSIEIAVYKELEDVAQPEHATVGANTLRYDNSIIRNESNVIGGPLSLGWEPLGRDVLLEQRMLAELQGRLAEVPVMRRLPE